MLVALVLVFHGNELKAQAASPVLTKKRDTNKKLDLQLLVTDIIGNHMRADSVWKLPKNYSFIYSIAISFDSAGQIENVYFSGKMPQTLIGILNPINTLKTKIRERWNNAREQKPDYSGKVVIFPILLQRESDRQISNVNELLEGFLNLWPDIDERDDKKMKILLKPFPNFIYQSVN